MDPEQERTTTNEPPDLNELAKICPRCFGYGMATTGGCKCCRRVWKRPEGMTKPHWRSRRLEPYAVLLALWLPTADVCGAKTAVVNYTMATTTQGARP